MHSANKVNELSCAWAFKHFVLYPPDKTNSLKMVPREDTCVYCFIVLIFYILSARNLIKTVLGGILLYYYIFLSDIYFICIIKIARESEKPTIIVYLEHFHI